MINKKQKIFNVRKIPQGYALTIKDVQLENREAQQEYPNYQRLLGVVSSAIGAYHRYNNELYGVILELPEREKLIESAGKENINILERIVDMHNEIVDLKQTKENIVRRGEN